MPTVHPCGCVCPCDPDKGREAMTALLRSKKDVEDADEALKIIRNSGASEEEVQVIVSRRNAAEQALGAAYKALTNQAAHPKLDEEEEAVETDVSDTESDDDVSMDVANSSAMSFGDDEDDEDYVPPEH